MLERRAMTECVSAASCWVQQTDIRRQSEPRLISCSPLAVQPGRTSWRVRCWRNNCIVQPPSSPATPIIAAVDRAGIRHAPPRRHRRTCRSRRACACPRSRRRRHRSRQPKTPAPATPRASNSAIARARGEKLERQAAASREAAAKARAETAALAARVQQAEAGVAAAEAALALANRERRKLDRRLAQRRTRWCNLPGHCNRCRAGHSRFRRYNRGPCATSSIPERCSTARFPSCASGLRPCAKSSIALANSRARRALRWCNAAIAKPSCCSDAGTGCPRRTGTAQGPAGRGWGGSRGATRTGTGRTGARSRPACRTARGCRVASPATRCLAEAP